MQIYVLKNRNLDIYSDEGIQGENNAEIMNFHFPDEIAGIDISKCTKWIKFKNENLDLMQSIENDRYSLTNLITQYENVKYQLFIKYKELFLFKSNIYELNFNESFDVDVTITLDDLSVINQLKLQLEELQNNYSIDKEELIELIATINELDKTLTENEDKRNQKFTELSRILENQLNEFSQKLQIAKEELENKTLELKSDLSNSSIVEIEKIQDVSRTEMEKFTSETSEYVLRLGELEINKANIDETGNKLYLDLDKKSYVFTIKLLDKNDKELSSKSIDLPLETMIIDVQYDPMNKELVITLQNNEERRISVADIVSGLVSEKKLEDEISKIQEKIAMLSDEQKYQNQKIEYLENNQLQDVFEGTSITLSNSAEAFFRNIALRSVISQLTREGYNLLDEKNLILFNNNTYISTVDFNTKGLIEVESDTVYSIVYKSGILSDSNLYLFDAENARTQADIKTVVQDDYTIRIFNTGSNVSMSFYAGGTVTYNSIEECIEKLGLMLLKGDYSNTALPTYEKYGKMPSLEYMSDAKYLNGNVDVKIQNDNQAQIYPIDFQKRNLLKLEDTEISSFGVTCSVKKQKIRLTGTATVEAGQTILVNFPVYLKKGTYRFNTTEFNKKYFTLRKNDLTWIQDLFNTTGSASNPVITIEDDDTYKIGLHIINGATYDDEFGLQISEGTNELAVVPYSEEEYEYSLIGENDKVVYLSDAEAAELGLTDGKGWDFYNEWGKYVFDGSENIVKTSETSSNIFYATIIEAIGDYCDGFCNYASNAKAYPNNKNTFAIRNSGTSVFFNSELSTAEEFKAKLKELYEEGKALYVVYPLAEPKYSKITNEILIEQLENFTKNAHTYKGGTNIEFIGENGQIKGIYFKDLEAELNNLKALILEN